MAIDLVKGQRIDIGLLQVVVGLGWDPAESSGVEYDLDASAFVLNERRKLLADSHFVFYGNQSSPGDAVVSSGDDRTGGACDGEDDESISVDLTRLPSEAVEIVFVATIHDAHLNGQNFGQVRNSYIRIYDTKNPSNVLCKYELGEDFSVESCIEFGRLYKRGAQWRFEALGVGYSHNGQLPLQLMVDKYT